MGRESGWRGEAGSDQGTLYAAMEILGELFNMYDMLIKTYKNKSSLFYVTCFLSGSI